MRKHLLALLALIICSQIHAGSLYGDKVRARLADADKDGVIDVRDKCKDTLYGTNVDHYGCSQKSTKLLSVELKVLFDTGKHEVKPAFYSELRELASFLKKNPASSVIIEGHTDNVGSKTSNQTLSFQRASAIAAVITDKFKIAPNRVQAKGFGETSPIASNETHSGREANRRVVAEVFSRQTASLKRWTIYSVDEENKTALTKR
ncbi:OmpA family protein [Marinomonas sp. MED121]|uniref:OmpA family protein n=1 Tax=Marinomonas sp. MED121 TaxID=314277 RepID=UPI000068FD18|nr:OmpA family protein [Marinomonas sp. MED121]EAQ63708.1 OmpA family protein [Marinomonas sp. MED121]